MMVSDEQFRAIGQVALQWAFLEGEIDMETLRLNKQNDKPQTLGAKFEAAGEGWRQSATRETMN